MNSDRKIPKKPDGSTDYMEIVRRLEAEQQADGSVETGQGVNEGRADLPEAPAVRANAIDAESAAEQEARTLLDGMLAAGASFQLLREAGEDVLVWFGPASSVTAEMRAFLEVFQTADAAEGLQAFLGKRPAEFRGE